MSVPLYRSGQSWLRDLDVERGQISACTNFLKQEVMTSTLRDLEVTGQNCGSQDFARAAENVNL